uniref:Uncharacterized protein n=1 Tax=Cacopsylla melanoneura TaxID=428564 RepID=A0A8D9F7X5_9HEMI
MFVFVCKTIPSFLFPSPFSFFYLFLPLSLSTALPSLFPFLYLCLPLLFLLLFLPIYLFSFFSLSHTFSSDLFPFHPLRLHFSLCLSLFLLLSPHRYTFPFLSLFLFQWENVY